MTYKTIFSGRLEFGSQRSFEQVTKMFEHRKENYYRSDIALNAEDIFIEDMAMLDIPRFITQTSERTWRNTINMLKTIAQYAIAGDMSAWMTDNGKLLHHVTIEPQGDKTAIQQFLRGRELINVDGKEQEAREALSRAIAKFERHAAAYERRGFVNYRLGNYKDALYDYNKSISIHPDHPDPYFGKAITLKAQGDLAGAIEQLAIVTKKAMPLETLHWVARRIKGDLHMQLGDLEAAMLEYKLFTNRNHRKEDPNYQRRRQVYFNYAKALLAAGRTKEAMRATDAALEISEGKEFVTDTDLACFREEHFSELMNGVY